MIVIQSVVVRLPGFSLSAGVKAFDLKRHDVALVITEVNVMRATTFLLKLAWHRLDMLVTIL